MPAKYSDGQFWAAFWAKTRVEGDCLLWTAKSRVVKGEERGLVWAKGRWRYAHKVALEWKLGRPVVSPLQANHTCDRPLCVEPAHLYEGTQQQNMDDMYARGRGRKARGNSHGRSKLTEVQIAEIRTKLALGVYQVDLAWEYGVSKQTISAINMNTRRQGIGLE
jgi:hypothetical protein